MKDLLLLGLPWIGLGMTIGVICLMAINNDPFDNLEKEIEAGIREMDL